MVSGTKTIYLRRLTKYSKIIDGWDSFWGVGGEMSYFSNKKGKTYILEQLLLPSVSTFFLKCTANFNPST